MAWRRENAVLALGHRGPPHPAHLRANLTAGPQANGPAGGPALAVPCPGPGRPYTSILWSATATADAAMTAASMPPAAKQAMPAAPVTSTMSAHRSGSRDYVGGDHPQLNCGLASR